jgi:hypothetical protein
VDDGSVAAGAKRQLAPAALIGRFWAPPQVIRYEVALCSTESLRFAVAANVVAIPKRPA